MRWEAAVANLALVVRGTIGSRWGARVRLLTPHDVRASTAHGSQALTESAPYWAIDVPELVAHLGSRREGLAQVGAQARLERYGPNRLAGDHDSGPLRLLARQFASPLVFILIFGATISLVLREWTDALIILAIVLGSTLLGF